MSKSQILIVDSDAAIAARLAELLASEGFEATHVASDAAALARLAGQRFDLAILNVGAEKMGWLNLLQCLRRQEHLPVLVLTADGGDEDGILGLEFGADDYLVKPFRARVLVARLRAILRRSKLKGRPDPAPITVGPLAIDSGAKLATMAGVPVRLTTAEFLLLEALARSAGRVQSRATLTRQALGRRLEPFDRSIDTHVSNLRRKLRLDARCGITIRSSRGRGYVLTVSTRAGSENRVTRVRLEMQKDMATWSSDNTDRTISDAAHYIANPRSIQNA